EQVDANFEAQNADQLLEEEDPDEPRTVKQFQQWRAKFENNVQLSAELLQDRLVEESSLQSRLRMIALTTEDVSKEFYRTVQAQKQGQEKQLAWVAGRFEGSGYKVLLSTLRKIHSPAFLSKLGITLWQAPDPASCRQLSWIQEESALLADTWKVLLELACARTWSQAMYWCCPPFLLGSSFASTAAEREGLELLRQLDAGLKAAHGLLQHGAADGDSRGPAIRDLLEDCFWPSCQLSLELVQAARDASFQPNNAQVLELAFACFGAPSNTKHACEDYTLVKRDRADIHGTYWTASETVPRELELNTMDEVNVKWVKSGTLADMRMAAATMTLAELHTSDFRNLEATWAGMFFVPGMIVLNSTEDGAVLSLGFRKWAAQTIPLEIEKDAQGRLLFILPRVQDQRPTQRPRWMWNTCASAEDTNFKACTVELLHPAAVPARLKEHSCVLEAVSPVEPLLKAALRSGRCFLDVPALKKLCVANGAADPTPTGKVGKKGKRSIMKIDRAQVLLAKIFPEIPAGSEEHSKILQGIMGDRSQPMTEACAADVLAGVKLLDRDNGEKFAGLAAVAQKIETDFKIKEEQALAEVVEKIWHLHFLYGKHLQAGEEQPTSREIHDLVERLQAEREQADAAEATEASEASGAKGGRGRGRASDAKGRRKGAGGAVDVRPKAVPDADAKGKRKGAGAGGAVDGAAKRRRVT
ncbi:unnamed protein product, partial [Symbiodinium sp. CCMP2456]